MRPVLAVAVLLLVPTAVGGAPLPPPARPQLRCERAVAAAAAGYVAHRGAALVACLDAALACPAALDAAATAAVDPCLAGVARRCNARLGRVVARAQRVERTGPRCVAAPPDGFGLAPGTLFSEDDGVGFALLPLLCPRTAVREGEPADASRCQRHALACATDEAVLAGVPRAAEVLMRLGVPLETWEGCLAVALCGNGRVDGDDEDCDDGPANSDVLPDACRTSCLDPGCGDGVVDSDEDCDDGNAVDGDGCESDCTPTEGECGDGVVGPDEDCDDGNAVDGDGCESDCTVTDGTCGDGAVGDDEDCDDGGRNSDLLPNRCRTDCTAPSCGDGVLDPAYGETCEPPGTLVCAPDCTLRLGPARLVQDPPRDGVARCQAAIGAAATRLLTRAEARIAACVVGIDRCMLSGEDEGCLEAAARRCAGAADVAARLGARLASRAAARCEAAGATVADLLDPAAGLGFATRAAGCAFPGTAPPTVADVLACAYGRVRCDAEAAVMRTLPRAGTLLWEALDDPEALFPCVEDLEDE